MKLIIKIIIHIVILSIIIISILKLYYKESKLYNSDVAFFAQKVTEFYQQFDCRNNTTSRDPRVAFILPNSLVINKNYSLSQKQLDEYWNETNSLKFTEECTQYPATFINIYGDYGNETNIDKQIQKTLCGCETHRHLLQSPPSPITSNSEILLKIKRGTATLHFPHLGIKPLLHRSSSTSTTGSFFHINQKGDIILSNPCSNLSDGEYNIDDILIFKKDVYNMKTRKPYLFEIPMGLRKKPEGITCIDQQVFSINI